MSTLRPAATFTALLSIAALLVSFAAAAQPGPPFRAPKTDKLFENWNTDACATTNTSGFSVDFPVRVTRVEVWYRWRTDEANVAFTVSDASRVIWSGTLERQSCDPYQERWCVAASPVRLSLQPGSYWIRAERGRICQNSLSSGNGFVRVYGFER